MSRQVVCIKDLELTKYDDDGYPTDNTMRVESGTVFTWDEENEYRFLGADIYLENEDMWIEITNENFKEHFEIIKESFENE